MSTRTDSGLTPPEPARRSRFTVLLIMRNINIVNGRTPLATAGVSDIVSLF
jgi:hypothetical protein